VTISPADLEFVSANTSAAMITIGADGSAKVAKVGVAVVGGQIWVSGTQSRVRTRRLRHDPRCTLYVHDKATSWVALESRVTILDGPDVPALSLRLFRQMQGKPSGPLSWFGGELAEEEFLQTMVDEGRLIYQFEVDRSYGLH
jgi:PPOX class probable F420-dependent enzyme